MHLALHATTLQDSLKETRCELRQLSNTFEVQATELHYLQNKVHDTFDGVFNWTGGPLVALKRARERLLKLQLPPKPPPNPTTRAHNRAPETLKLSRRDVEKHLPQVQKVVSKYGEDFFAEMDRQVKVADDLATKNAELVKARNSLRRELHTVKDKAGTARVNEARMQGIAGNLQHQVRASRLGTGGRRRERHRQTTAPGTEQKGNAIHLRSGTVTSLRAFALLNEQRGDLTDDLRATINQKRREAKQTSSHVDNDKDQHVAAYQERRANADAEVAFAAEEAARNEAEVRRQEQEKAEKQAKVAEERSQREKAKELEQVAVAQRKEEREKKRKEALLEKQKKQAASLR
ncbi:hypothetical protein CYMTET_35276 [Cymbomonas tetramitiformis]|uniref:Uncharacterized protein n=1 Tax=Cymbomonas tetramitiformis TaxID=36881 RepID=A0AAE0KPB9_9CHLO|nr:hypothetical protein CYMTET_35276 [Cymbomonas tetramitiformis]